ncbi:MULTISPECIES: AAA family ATPase [unclassified Haloferax]|uniref:AAA family ATPase n=1 Tax=Haloferax sp. Atlit-48N TaxID=2077198 RepID=A0ACD5HXE2_9EURY|nr:MULTISPECIES: AAA family ATPase [unclassified Haloferax]
MELIGVEIRGFRRFGDPVNVRLLEGVIAIVGQNEAGKTSFLEALEELNSQDEVAKRDRTRRIDTETEVKVRFELDEDDWADLQPIDGAEDIEQCTLSKKERGEIVVNLEPAPSHDLEPRKNVRSRMKEFTESDIFSDKIGGRMKSEIQSLVDILDSDEDYLESDILALMKGPITHLESLAQKSDTEEYDVKMVSDLKEDMERLIEHEEQSSPEKARRILRQRRPGFIRFDEECRDLKPIYDLKEEVPGPPKALDNLAELADLDLETLRDAVIEENIAFRDDLLESANDALNSKFSEAWVRSDVVPVLSVDGTVLHVNVRTPDDRNRAPIDQRSEGLRWFIALVSFLNQKGATQPVLLVDEAESHLSYDAQAELIEVLETQDIAQKVIYTTHSAGCLPSDLGRGIRPVITQEGERSDIRNGFWMDGPGFKPIMGAMGLGPLAFSMTRNALIAEGPSETILLPTLIRQATGKSELQYQVAPGASNVGGAGLPELLSETGRSVILLDGDDAGVKSKKTLTDTGADPEKVRTYRDFGGEPLVFEDLIDPGIYTEAVNEELNTWQNPDSDLVSSDLPDMNRVGAVEQWCNDQGLDSPVKTNVCQRLAEKASQGEQVVDSDKTQVLIELNDWAEEHFVLFTN